MIESTNQLVYTDYASSYRILLASTALFRDPSAWYHIVLAVDTTQATASDRAKMYVNGAQITQFSSATYPALNLDTFINNAQATYLGAYNNSGTGIQGLFDGYMAEVNFIDGQALDPTSFGEFKSDIWVPKAYTGTYGTNGFYLPFSDSAAIGDDLSGNANDWTPSGLVAGDVMLDSPTNNYAVLNPLSPLASGAYSDGNLRFTTGTTDCIGIASIGPQSGKWYAEITATTVVGSADAAIGVVGLPPSSITTDLRFVANGYSYLNSGNKANNGTSVAYGATYTSGDVIGVALDLDTSDVEFFKNGVSQGVAYSGLSGPFTFAMGDLSGANGGTVFDCNFGQSPFAYTPPAGFLALNTANLPEPTITPALDDVPADYFNTVLYTGTGAAQSITGVGFQPDWTWIKGRSGATDHALYDAVRGVQEQLESNQTGAETTEATGLTAFGADGFSVGALAQLNTSTATYVAWNWLAGNGTSSNTDGSITSTVSVNQKAGFSIVSYTGTGAAATVGHGLGAAPSMVIVKNRDQADAWQVYHGANTANPETDYLVLNTTAATADAADRWNDTLPTSSVFSLGNGATVNTNTEDYIAYCFAEVEGFSKFGSYTGNGSTDGPFVYCGFRPAWLMIKRTNSTANWYLMDDQRPRYNETDLVLYPNLTATEATVGGIDFLSNGFKPRSNNSQHNASGGTYIFAAFAEQPVKYSNAR
jgi:hypothetical protein